MITVPRWFLIGMATAAALYAVVLAVVELDGRAADLVALLLFVVAFSVCIGGRGRLPAAAAVVGLAVAVAVPALTLPGVDPTQAGPPLGSWSVPAVGAFAVLLQFRRRGVLAWCAVAAGALQTFLWDGLSGVTRYGVFAELLILALITAGGLVIRSAERELRRSASVERSAIRWRTAEAAYHEEREARLATMVALSERMLQRIAAQRGVLDAEDQAQCRVLHSTIRDETRGKRLLNDAVRAQVLVHRRRGATVQLNDDGGLDDLDPSDADPLLDQVAAALKGVPSDLIVIRTSPRESTTAITVVATSVDPIAAALGLDDGDRVDLWLELERPAGPGVRPLERRDRLSRP